MTPLQDSACQACSLSGSCLTTCIPGEGPLDASLMVLGIGPGGVEDRSRQSPMGLGYPLGRPFVGDSGRLLRSMLLSNGFAEPDPDHPDHPRPLVRLTNVVRCRPPENRDPTAAEMKACARYLGSELAAMPNLKYVVALGTIPMKALFVVGSVTDLAGVPRKTQFAAEYRDEVGTYMLREMDLTVIPIMHPAGVLRRQTYISTWQSHWDQIRNIVRPPEKGFVDRINSTLLPEGLQGRDWRVL